jgi:hypothetical protein
LQLAYSFGNKKVNYIEKLGKEPLWDWGLRQLDPGNLELSTVSMPAPPKSQE